MTLIAVSERRVSFFVCVALTISERKIIRCKNPVIPDNNNTDNRRECECKWKSSICSLYEKQILTETLSKLCSTWIWIFAPVDECLVLSLRVLHESDSNSKSTFMQFASYLAIQQAKQKINQVIYPELLTTESIYKIASS